MAKESDLQATIMHWLQGHGAVAFKYQQNATTRAALPDIFWCYKKAYGFLEVKKDSKASFRPGQKETLEGLGKWTFAKVVFPENWGIIREEIEDIIRNEDL